MAIMSPPAPPPNPAGSRAEADRTADPTALDPVVELWPRVFGFALSLTRDPNRAEDLSQESFARYFAARNRNDTDDSRPALPYLLTICRNTFISETRRRRPELLGDDDPGADGAHDPVEHVTAQETRDQVRVALAELPEAWRAALYLRDGLGLSYSDIADVIGKSVDGVRTTLHRARGRIRERLEKSYWKGATE